jgi:hypothetical protein
VPAGQVVLADGSLDREGVLGHVRGERAVGAVDVVVGAPVDDDRELDGRHDQSLDPADRPDLPGAADEHGCLAALAGEQVGSVDAAGSAGGGQPLRAEGGLDLAERSLVPGTGVSDVDDGGDGRGAGRGDAAVADTRAGFPGWSSRSRSVLTAFWVRARPCSSRLRCAEISSLRAGTSGAASTPRIWSIGMSSSRNLRMTCAVGIWSVV